MTHRTPLIRCPTREELLAYATGKIDDETGEGIAEHIDSCPSCQAAIATIDDKGDTLLERLRRPAAPDPYEQEPRCAVTERRTRVDWAFALRNLLDEKYQAADRVVLVLDNLNTHSPGSFYEAFTPSEARRLTERLEIHYTPKHGSWLNIAECELSVLGRQCLARRIDDGQRLADEIAAWEGDRNLRATRVNWQFTTDAARVKLRRLYPEFVRQDEHVDSCSLSKVYY